MKIIVRNVIDICPDLFRPITIRCETRFSHCIITNKIRTSIIFPSHKIIQMQQKLHGSLYIGYIAIKVREKYLATSNAILFCSYHFKKRKCERKQMYFFQQLHCMNRTIMLHSQKTHYMILEYVNYNKESKLEHWSVTYWAFLKTNNKKKQQQQQKNTSSYS